MLAIILQAGFVAVLVIVPIVNPYGRSKAPTINEAE